MEGTQKLNRKKATIAIVPAVIFALGIPSLPLRPYHLLFWAIAFLAEIAILFALRPLTQDSN